MTPATAVEPTTRPPEDPQARANAAVWARGDFLPYYVGRDLRPPEVLALVRHADALTGDVLELGCGAGRVTCYLAALARSVRALDLSPKMVDHCRRTCPGANVEVGDMRDLSGHPDGAYTGVVASCNLLDVLSDAERRRVLSELRRVLAPGGVLLMSSHNRGYVPKLRTPLQVRTQDPLRLAADLVRMPRRLRNRRRVVGLETEGPDYAVINDGAHEYSLLHYFISRDAQERQFAELGFELLECLDLGGRPVQPGEEAGDCVELHYVARRPETG